MKLITFLILFQIFRLPLSTQAETVSGTALEKGTRKPLAGINVFLLPEKEKQTTDENGKFTFKGRAKESTVVVNLPGYIRFEQKITFADKADEESTDLSLYVEKEFYAAFETTITAKEKKRDPMLRSIRAAEAASQPGSFGDPIRAVQNLAGINRPAAASAQVIIQGAGPNETGYTIDGHEVPSVFHFGGFSSILFPEAIDRVDLLAAGYGTEFGRANGGYVNLWTRSPKKDRVHGYAYMDLINAGALIEGPWGEKSSFLLSARTSYISFVLGAVAPDNEEFDLTLAPTFSDATLITDTQVNDRLKWKNVLIGSSDALDFLLKQPLKTSPAIRGAFSTRNSFFRFIPQLTYEWGANRTLKLSLGAGKNWVNFNTSENFFDLNATYLTARGEWEERHSPSFTAIYGWDNRYAWAAVNAALPNTFGSGGVSNPVTNETPIEAKSVSSLRSVGLYTRFEFRPSEGPLTLSPQFRVEGISNTREIALLPRFSAVYDWDDSLKTKMATGLYAQPAEPQQTDSTFGNPNLKSPRAFHATVGYEKDFRGGRSDGWSTGSDLFYRDFSRQVVRSSNIILRDNIFVPENFTNNGNGYAYGVQNTVKWDQAPWGASLIYTLSRSRRSENGGADRPFQFDQTHLIGLIASWESGRWKVSSRFRYATGNPFTPVIASSWDSNGDSYRPIRGQIYSERQEAFSQLDFRVDHKWVYDKWILSAYLDVQNALNRKNVEGTVYSFDFSQRDSISGLPIIPSIGLRGEF